MSSDRFEGGFDDEPLAPRRTSGIDPTTKRLLLLAGGLGGVLVVILAVWGLRGAPSGPPPLITPEPGPVRVKPADPGGLKVDQDAAILEGGTKEGGEKLITPAEKPAPEALAEAAAPQAPGAAPFSPAGQAQSAPAPSSPASSSPASTASPGGAASVPAPAAPASPQAATPAPASSTVASAPGASAASAAAQAPAKPKAAELVSAASNAAPARAASSHAAGKVAVQLAALPTEEAAHAEWERLLARHRDLLGGRHPEILKASRDGRTFFRLRVGGFASTAEAARFCHALIAEGGACAVAAF
jgi:hypothetical protein